MGKGIYALVAIIRTEGQVNRMSDDLISRKAVLKELREIMDEPHSIMFLMGIGVAISVVGRAETAFDKEKVIEELEDYLFEKYCVEGDEKIAEIVEKGGIE